MASETNIFTVRVPIKLQREIDAIAGAMERTRSWIIHRALQEFVTQQAWQIGEIREAIREADCGDFATEEEIEALNNKYKRQSGGICERVFQKTARTLERATWIVATSSRKVSKTDLAKVTGSIW